MSESLEKKSRDLLRRIGVEHTHRFTNGDLVELANMFNRITELEAQLADAQQVNQWHPIETAPKDGQLIFLWNPKEPAVSKFGKWARHLETSHFCWTSPKNISYSNLPTHWMPLPAAPAIAAGKQA